MTGLVLPAVDLPAQIEVSSDTLWVDGHLHFNAWREAVRGLLAVESGVQWYLGDLWLAGQERFGLDYIPALDELALRFPQIVDYGRVARAFPPRSESEGLSSGPGRSVATGVYRVEGVSWSHHRVCAGIADEQERMAWVEDVLRQNWSKRQLEAEIAASYARDHARAPSEWSFTLRAAGDVASRCQARADALGIDPKQLALAVLDLAFQLEDPIGILQAAGAQFELEAA